MKYLLVLLTSSLSATKVTLQGRLAKRMHSVADGAFFNALIFLVAALLFSPSLLAASKLTWTYAAIYAVCNVVFQTVYAGALSRGNVSLAVMFANFGMLVPTAVSFAVWGDNPSLLRIIGIALIMVAFIFTLKQGGEHKKGYFPLVIVAMLANGCGLTIQKIYATHSGEPSLLSFVAASYMLSAILSASVCFVLSKTSASRVDWRLGSRQILCCVGAGAALALFLGVNMYAGKVVDGSFHYPTHSLCTMLLAILSSIVIFREKISVRQGIACGIGVTAILLMNF